jgi:hypothetical protein
MQLSKNPLKLLISNVILRLAGITPILYHVVLRSKNSVGTVEI